MIWNKSECICLFKRIANDNTLIVMKMYENWLVKVKLQKEISTEAFEPSVADFLEVFGEILESM